MRSTLFWDVTQSRLVVKVPKFRDNGPIFKVQGALKNLTDSLSQNNGTLANQSTLPNIQK